MKPIHYLFTKKLQIVVGVTIALATSAAHSLESTDTIRCRYMAAMVKDIATDRDDGLSYKNRIAKNNRLAYDMPDMRNAMGQVTNMIYSDAYKKTPPDKLSEETLIACLRGN